MSVWLSRLRLFVVIPLVLATIATSGCIKRKILVKVKPDGTGHIVVTTIVSKQMATMYELQMSQMDSMGAADDSMPKDPFFYEAGLKRSAGNFGAGVTYVKGKKYDKDGAKGSLALYAFDDIDDVFINLDSLMEDPEAMVGFSFGGMDDEDEDEEIEIADMDENAMTFSLEKGSIAALTVVVPEYPEAKKLDEEADPEEDEEDEEDDTPISADPSGQQQLQMMMAMGNPYGLTGNETESEMSRKMLKGMLVSISVEIAGELVSSNAEHPVKGKRNRSLLLEMNSDKIFESELGRNSMDAMQDGFGGVSGLVGYCGGMRNLPGITLQATNLTVKFK